MEAIPKEMFTEKDRAIKQDAVEQMTHLALQ